jgi:two-component system, NtrC family, sensor histidine kinase PilS
VSAPADRTRPGPFPRAHPVYLLRGVFLGRMALATGILLGAFATWEQADPGQTLVVTILFLSVLTVTGWGTWVTQIQKRTPGRGFLFAQMAFDAFAVTAIVHVTGGAGSVFAALYIPVIGISAVLLPGSGLALIGGLCAILYIVDSMWGHDIEVLAGPLFLQVGLFGVVAVVTGILGDRLRRTGTALGEVESELRRLRLDTSDILASVTSGILTVDEKERMIFLNPAGEALLGLDAGRWEGLPVLDEVAEVAPGLGTLLRRALEEGTSLFRRTAEAVRDREHLILGVAITVRDAQGEPRAATAIFQDITDQERLALLNRQNERLGAVAELAASMAHEIKNPLASIRSAVEQFTSPRITDGDREKLTEMVVRESDRLSRLLSDFIDFARVRVTQNEKVDLRKLVEDAVAVVCQHPDAERGEVRIELDAPDHPVPLTGDGDVLHRAILNLTLNAVQFSPEGETVRVRVDDLRHRSERPRVGVERPVSVRVRDRGPGIPEEELSRLFDPFFTTRKGGSGLGLAMVHRAVEAHRGAVVVESPPDGGAEFILYLPGERAVTHEPEVPMSVEVEVENV